MKLTTFVFLATFLALVTSLPWRDQIALVNALQVGRNQDPMTWGCVGCDDSNKPLTSVVIQRKAKDVKSILSVYEEYTVLAFRYTSTVKNVAQDLLWAFQTQDQHSCKGCKVQKFFDGMWNSIRGDVLEGLRQSVHTGRLVITGISLGGALSCLSYVDIARSGIFSNVQVVTFGAPRVGNSAWAQWFDQITPSTRYFIKADPIAFLPRCLTPVCNYKQTGTAYICDKTQEVCTKKVKSEDNDNQTDSEKYINDFIEAVNEHYNEEDGNVDGIIDHIVGYKKILQYTRQE